MSLDKSTLLKSSLSILTVLSGICGSQAMEKPRIILKVSRNNTNIVIPNAAVVPLDDTNMQIDNQPTKTITPKIRLKKGGMKRLNEVENNTYWEGVPTDVLLLILDYLGNSDKKFEGICKTWQNVANQYNLKKFEPANQISNYVSFNDTITPLSQRMIYVTNERLATLIAMFHNINRNHGSDIDRAHFERLAARFIGTPLDKNKDKGIPFFEEKAVLKKFVELLQTNAAAYSPTVHQQGQTKGNKSKATKLKKDLVDTLSFLCNTGTDAKYQNEMFLNYCIRKFIDYDNSTFTNEAVFNQITSSLKDLITNNNELIGLRDVQNPSHGQWKRIIDLDKGSTVDDLRNAAITHFNAGLFAEAAGYRKQVLDKAGNNTTVEDLRSTANAHLNARLFAEAAEYSKKMVEKAGVNATVKDLRSAAIAHFKAGLLAEAAGYHKQVIDKAGNDATMNDLRSAALAHSNAGLFAEAAGYRKQVIDRAGNDVAVEDLRNAAFTHFNAGLLAEAAGYRKQVIEKSGDNATLNDLQQAAFAHFNAGLLAEAAGYRKQVIEKSGDNATLNDLQQAAFAHFNAGLFAEAAGYRKQVIEKSGDNATVDDLRNAAGAHFKAGLFAEAAAYYKQVLDMVGANATVTDLVGAAKTNFDLGLFMEADQYMSRVINFPGYILSPKVEEISQKIRQVLGK